MCNIDRVTVRATLAFWSPVASLLKSNPPDLSERRARSDLVHNLKIRDWQRARWHGDAATLPPGEGGKAAFSWED